MLQPVTQELLLKNFLTSSVGVVSKGTFLNVEGGVSSQGVVRERDTLLVKFDKDYLKNREVLSYFTES